MISPSDASAKASPSSLFPAPVGPRTVTIGEDLVSKGLTNKSYRLRIDLRLKRAEPKTHRSCGAILAVSS
jgi:hypothetical protein